MTPTRLRKHHAPTIRRRRPLRSDSPVDLPPVNRLFVVACYFNPMRCPIVLQNAQRFLRQIKAPIRVVELSFDGSHDLTADLTLHVTDPARQTLWQKERLLNLAADTLLPDDCDAIAWIDMDVRFDNPDWRKHAEHILSHNHVCQLWSHSYELKDIDLTELRPSVCYGFTQNDPLCFHLGHYHPGFAWAMRRDTWLRIGGLLDTNVVGNGDTHMARGFLNSELWTDRFMSDAWKADADRWKERTAAVTQHRIGCVPGALIHHWHGDRTGRRYVERLSYLGDHSFDPATDLRTASNGLLEWTDAAIRDKPHMIAKVKGYFDERRISLQSR